MALPGFLKGLPESATRWYSTIEAASARNMSGREIVRMIQMAGGAISRATVNRVTQGIRGVLDSPSNLRFLRRDSTPDFARFQTAKTDILRRYSVKLEVRGFNARTGEPVTRFIQVSFDDPLSRWEIENLALDYFDGSERYEDMTVQSIATIMGYRRADA